MVENVRWILNRIQWSCYLHHVAGGGVLLTAILRGRFRKLRGSKFDIFKDLAVLTRKHFPCYWLKILYEKAVTSALLCWPDTVARAER